MRIFRNIEERCICFKLLIFSAMKKSLNIFSPKVKIKLNDLKFLKKLNLKKISLYK